MEKLVKIKIVHKIYTNLFIKSMKIKKYIHNLQFFPPQQSTISLTQSV